jgi:hypothetical protein
VRTPMKERQVAVATRESRKLTLKFFTMTPNTMTNTTMAPEPMKKDLTLPSQRQREGTQSPEGRTEFARSAPPPPLSIHHKFHNPFHAVHTPRKGPSSPQRRTASLCPGRWPLLGADLGWSGPRQPAAGTPCAGPPPRTRTSDLAQTPWFLRRRSWRSGAAATQRTGACLGLLGQ